jgi:hypothetical protein
MEKSQPTTSAEQPDPLDGVRVMPGDASGCWLVRTARTTHLFDFERIRYARVPDEGRKAMPYDREWLALRGLRNAPTVGGQFAVYVDALDASGRVVEEMWRVSAWVVSLERVERQDLPEV